MKKVWFFLTFLSFVCIIEWEEFLFIHYNKNMKNKKFTLKLGFLAAAVWCFSLSFTSATVFRLNIDKIESLSEVYLSDKIIPIHFADNWNDFGWFFYFSNGLIEETTWEEDPGWETDPEITTGYYVTIDNNDLPWRTETYECDRQIKWFYYNAERWERLWPLDQETWSSIWVDTTWGFYTMCQKEWYTEKLRECLTKASNGVTDFESCKKAERISFATDGDGYYGYIKHTYSGQEMALIAGVNYNPGSYSKFIPISSGGWFSPSFVRIGNKYPVWFVYDYNWWVWLVWCRVTPLGTIKNIITEYNRSDVSYDLNKMFREIGGELHYNGTDADCSNAVWDPLIWVVIEWVVWMGEMWNDNKFGVIWNQMNQKMQYFSSADINNNTIINYARKKAELLCRWKWKSWRDALSTNWDVLCVDGRDVEHSISKETKHKLQTLIVKNWNVTIRPFDYNEEGYYDIFIDSWNLIIDEPADTQKFVFDKNWFPTSYGTEQFSTDVNTAGEYTWDYAAIGSFIRWNFIVNWNIKSAWGSGLQNKYFMHWKISTRDDFDTLLDTFKWRCNYWNATDGTYCPMSIRWKWENPYDNASLVIIDQNYNSPFFND